MSVSKLSRAYLFNAAAFIPVILFLLYGRFGPGAAGVRWETAYVIGGILAIPHMIWLINSRAGHWIALGVDLYLLVGALLAAISESAVQVWGQDLGAAPVLASVFVVGIAATLFSPLGFIGEISNNRARIRQLSLMLLITAAIAAAVSLAFRHSPLLGGVLPIVALVLVRGQLGKRLATAA